VAIWSSSNLDHNDDQHPNHRIASATSLSVSLVLQAYHPSFSFLEFAI